MGGQTNAINSSGQTNGKKATVSFPRLFLSHPHLLRSVTAGFSQSLAWLGWDAPSLPDAVGGSGREVIVFFFLVASSSGSTSVDDDSDDGRAAGKRREETTLLASGFDRRRQKGVARDAERECWGRQRSGSRKEKRGGGKFCFFSLSSFLIRVEVAGDRLWSIFLHFFAIRSTLDCQSPRVRAKAFRGEHPFTTLNFLPFSFVLACARQRALDSERPCLAVRRVELWRNER